VLFGRRFEETISIGRAQRKLFDMDIDMVMGGLSKNNRGTVMILIPAIDRYEMYRAIAITRYNKCRATGYTAAHAGLHTSWKCELWS